MGSVVYTSIFGDYDTLKDPIVYSDGIDYICFTDNKKLRSDIWDIRISDGYRGDSVRSAKRFKMGPHVFLKEYEYSLYIDGNMTLKVIPDIERMLNGKTIAKAKHVFRDCIYTEGAVCMSVGIDTKNRIDRQLKTYAQQGYPAGAGLYMSGLIPRKHNDRELSELNELWWYHVCIHSSRDQISFPVVFRDYPVGNISMETWESTVDLYLHEHQKGYCVSQNEGAYGNINK